jgi:uncharacterized protein YjbI with pentapeptide repeats
MINKKAEKDEPLFLIGYNIPDITFKLLESTDIHNDIYFNKAEFRGLSAFNGITFHGIVSFVDAVFSGSSDFSNATFIDKADFSNASFSI